MSLDTSYTPKPWDPTLEWTVQHAHLFHPVAEFRKQVVDEIHDLVFDMQEETAAWLNTLPMHIQHTYTTAKQVTQVYYTYLLQQIRYPQADITHGELSSGFRLMGHLQPGTNWYIRTDQKYLNPKNETEFVERNENYIQKKLQQARVDDHYRLHADARRDRAGSQDGQDERPLHTTSALATPNHLPE